MPVSETGTSALTGQSAEAASRGLRRRALLVSGMGFFTDAYDLFVIGIVSTLLKTQWHLGTSQLALLNAVMLGAAFLGAIVFGRLADKVGRTRVYRMSAALMVIAAAGSALAPSLTVLIAFRFLLGFGVGGDYPVSAVLMSEYAGRGNFTEFGPNVTTFVLPGPAGRSLEEISGEADVITAAEQVIRDAGEPAPFPVTAAGP